MAENGWRQLRPVENSWLLLKLVKNSWIQLKTRTLLTSPLCTVGCCCWSWPRTINNDTKINFFHTAMFDHFWATIDKSETKVISDLFPKESFCNYSILVLTFVKQHKKTHKKWHKWHKHKHVETERLYQVSGVNAVKTCLIYPDTRIAYWVVLFV